jgi:hypothetical protein
MVSNQLHFTVIFLFIKNKIYSQQQHSAQSHLTVKKIGEGYQSLLILLQKTILYIKNLQCSGYNYQYMPHLADQIYARSSDASQSIEPTRGGWKRHCSD